MQIGPRTFSWNFAHSFHYKSYPLISYQWLSFGYVIFFVLLLLSDQEKNKNCRHKFTYLLVQCMRTLYDFVILFFVARRARLELDWWIKSLPQERKKKKCSKKEICTENTQFSISCRFCCLFSTWSKAAKYALKCS